MTPLAPAALEAALVATWPAAELVPAGAFVVRRSRGGGRRPAAATLAGDGFTAADIDAAEARMRLWGQPLRFRLSPRQPALDAALSARGYTASEPSLLMAAPVAGLLAIEVPRLSAFDLWPPLAIMTEIWREGGIGPDRLAVMDRVDVPRTALFGRQGDRPAAAAFLAAGDGIAMIHALHVRSEARRNGLARRLLGHAARWAAAAGCTHLALSVSEGNAPAVALYRAIGMAEADRYLYRERREPEA